MGNQVKRQHRSTDDFHEEDSRIAKGNFKNGSGHWIDLYLRVIQIMRSVTKQFTAHAN